MHRYIFGVLIAWFAIPFDVVAADHIVRFPKRADHAQYSVIRMAARRSLITVKDSRADNGPETRGVIMRGGFDGGPVRIPDGHAVAIFAVSPAVNGSCGPIDLSFLDALGNNDLCELDVSQNFLTCQQVKSLSRFSRIVELRTFIDNDCNTPRCLDELKGLEVLVLAFRKEMDTRDSAGWVAAAVKHKSLRSLTLDGLRPNDEQMKKLVSLQKLECLQLNSSKSDVTNRGLAELVALKELREAVLQVGESVSDDGLKPFFQMRRLEKLAMGGAISVAAAERLQLAHPAAELEFFDLRRE